VRHRTGYIIAMRWRPRFWLLPVLLSTGGMPSAVPALIKGRFIDDYGITHMITDSLWSLGGRDRYWIVESEDTAGYLIARNDEANASDPGRWTRIDWIPLAEMAPFEWAFCMIEYKAGSAAEARAANQADRIHPRKGCNGFPFSRMRRAYADSTPTRQYR
jgi:hypothetical protein